MTTTPLDLLRECQRVNAHGLTRMILTIPRRRVRGRRVRVMRGVLGNVCGGQGDRLLVDVYVADVVWALEQVMGPAASAAAKATLAAESETDTADLQACGGGLGGSDG